MSEAGRITLPGVVAIDEVDAHLHPEWQARIGEWFVERFPNMQFFVTTHSPMVSAARRRAAASGCCPTQGSDDEPRRVTGVELDRLIHGSILDAYGTELFGERCVTGRPPRKSMERCSHELARLNRKALTTELSSRERARQKYLRATLPNRANRILRFEIRLAFARLFADRFAASSMDRSGLRAEGGGLRMRLMARYQASSFDSAERRKTNRLSPASFAVFEHYGISVRRCLIHRRHLRIYRK